MMNSFIEHFHRWKWRTLLPFIIIAVAFKFMEPLTTVTGIPDLPRILPAIATLFICEWALAMRRAIFNPKINFQSLVETAATTPNGAAQMAVMYATGTLIRLGLLLCAIYLGN